MNYMTAEVHTQSNGYDETVHGADVESEAPPVEKARHISECEEDTHHHKQGAPPAAQGQQCGEKYTNWKKIDVLDEYKTQRE